MTAPCEYESDLLAMIGNAIVGHGEPNGFGYAKALRIFRIIRESGWDVVKGAATVAEQDALKAENARLREALKRIAILGKPLKSENWSTGNEEGADAEALTRDFGFDAGIKACAEMAREALAGEVKP